MTLIAGGRLAQIAAKPIVVASESCIDRYGDAVTDAKLRRGEGRHHSPHLVVDDCAHFEAAWTALGQVRFLGATTVRRAWRRRRSSGPSMWPTPKSSDLYNNLGYIETADQALRRGRGEPRPGRRIVTGEPDRAVQPGRARRGPR